MLIITKTLFGNYDPSDENVDPFLCIIEIEFNIRTLVLGGMGQAKHNKDLELNNMDVTSNNNLLISDNIITLYIYY